MSLKKQIIKPIIYINGFGLKKKRLSITRLLGIFLILVPVTFLAFSSLHKENIWAANYVWDGGGADNLCTTGANWVGDSAPSASDIAVFNSTSSKAATIDCDLDGIDISGYSGTVTLAQDTSITSYTQSSGTLNTTSSYTLTVSNGFAKTNGTFKYNLTLTGGNLSNNGTFGDTGSGSLTIDGDVTAASNLSWYFVTTTINSGNTFDLGSYDFYVNNATSTVVNNSTMTGTTGTWDTTGSYTGAVGSTVSAPASWVVDKNFVNEGDITHNNGTLTVNNSSASDTYTFDPGSSDLYNLVLAPNGSGITSIARSFDVLNDLTINDDGDVNNPATSITINVSGNVSLTNTGVIGGSNLTINMTGSSKTLTETANQFNSNIILAGSDTSISSNGSFGHASATFTVAGTSHTVTTTTNLLNWFFGTTTINSGNTFELGSYDFYVNNATSTIVNNGTLTGTTGTWDTSGSYTGAVGSTVSAPASWVVDKNFVNEGDITHNNGTLTVNNSAFSGTYTFDPGSSDLYNLVLAPYSSRNTTIARSFNVLNDLTLNGDGTVNNPATPITINVSGDVTASDGQIGGNNLTISMVGDVDQSFSTLGSIFYSNLEINKSSGVVYLTSNISVSAANQRLDITAGTLATAGYNLILSGAGAVFSNEGILRIQGGETLTFARDSDSGTVEYVGSGSASYPSLNYGDNYYNLTINSTSGTDSFTAAAATSVIGSFTITSGTFIAPSSNLTIGGDFTNSGGSFTHNSGTVILNTTTTANVTGSTTFNNLTSSTGGKTINFGARDTQTIIGTTTLSGLAGNLLVLRSAASPTQWQIDPQGVKDITYVDVQDSNNISVTSIAPTNSVDSYNNTNWFSYSVTALAGSNGSINPSGVSDYDGGSDPTYTITPDTGYHVADVLVDSVSVGAVSEYAFTDIGANHTIEANFAINSYTINSSTGSNGSINPTGSGSYNYGTNQTYTITPDVNYHVADVLVDSISVGAITGYEFISIAANHTISATFAIDVKTITVSVPSGNGSISPSGTLSISYGEDQLFTITPASGYEINDVLVDGASVGKVTSYLMQNITTNHTILAVFGLILSETESESMPLAPPNPTPEITPTPTATPQLSSSSDLKDNNEQAGIALTKVSGGGPLGFITSVMFNITEKIVDIIKATPPPVAYSFPYFLFILLGVMILNFALQTKREINYSMKLKQLLETEKNIAAEKDNFLMLSAHYLRTPMTLIKGAAEALASGKKISKVLKSSLETTVKHLSNAVENVLQKINDNSYLKQIESSASLQKKSVKTYSSPWFIIPLVLTILISIFANVLFVKVANINIHYLNYLAEIIVFAVIAQLFVLFFRKRQNEKANRQYFEQVYEHQTVVDNAKNDFINESYTALKTDLDNLDKIVDNKNTDLKTLNEGYYRIREVVEKFGLAASIKTASQGTNLYRTIDTANLINDVLKSKKSIIEAKKLRIKLQNTALIEQNKRKLSFVLESILDNAIKFSRESGEVIIANQYKNGLLTISVTDTGVGIPKNQIERLFKPFSRASSALNFDYEGMGFSLYLAKLMMNSLGGDIAVESKEGLGTTVQVLFGQQAPVNAFKNNDKELLPVAKPMAEII